MSSFLTIKQCKEYKELHKKCKNKHFADRIKSILWLNDGDKYEEIARRLMLDEVTIRRYHKQYQDGGIDALIKDDYKGSEPYLSQYQQNELIAYLEENICLSSKEVCCYVEKQYGMKYSVKGMTNLLHRLGFVYKKPKHLPSKANREAQEASLKRYEELKATKEAKDRIYFIDGCHPMHNSQLSYGWFKKGKEKFIKANTGRKRVNINGAYNAEEKKVIVREDESINSQSTIALIKQIKEQQCEGIIYLVADNATYYRSRIVKEFLNENQRVKMLFLPPYSPNLNLIERLWKFLKKKVIYNEYYEKFAVFKEKIMETLKNTERYQHELESSMTEKFQLFPP